VTVAFAITAAVLFGTGAYLVLGRDLVRLVLGLVLISQAAVLTLVASSLRRGAAPIYPLPRGEVSDPLSQAMALTAIVIGLAVTALVLALVVRVVHAFRSDELDEMAEEEAQRDARTESSEGEAHAAEEAAAR
jgi:multicomponent Na+:H+ antiporter subunit C